MNPSDKTTWKWNLRRGLAAMTLLLVQSTLLSGAGQAPSGLDRERGRAMLSSIKEELKKGYYDPTFHGMDVEARFTTADEKIKQAQSLGQIFGIIGQALADLNDSHTFFIPPSRTSRA